MSAQNVTKVVRFIEDRVRFKFAKKIYFGLDTPQMYAKHQSRYAAIKNEGVETDVIVREKDSVYCKNK